MCNIHSLVFTSSGNIHFLSTRALCTECSVKHMMKQSETYLFVLLLCVYIACGFITSSCITTLAHALNSEQKSNCTTKLSNCTLANLTSCRVYY